ncbi:MAG: CoA-transferase [Anaerolineae bacterium]
MAEAIAAYVQDGMSVAIEGFTALICFAAGHEIIRQRRRDLTLIRMTPDLIYDQMIAAGVARKLVFSYLGNPGVGQLHGIRRAVEKGVPGPLEIEEYSHYGMVGRYYAGAARLPLSIGDPTLVSGATSVIPMADLFGLYLQGGRVEVALLGGAQIDRFGNLNTHVIGDYGSPQVRLPGSGGACEIAINAQQTHIIMRLKRRAFVERLDFLTSPGHLSGGNSRRELGMPGRGPQRVITDKAIFDFDNAGREMQLVSLHPGLSLDEVRAEIGWQIRLPAPGHVAQTPPPGEEELRLVRVELDPDGVYR